MDTHESWGGASSTKLWEVTRIVHPAEGEGRTSLVCRTKG